LVGRNFADANELQVVEQRVGENFLSSCVHKRRVPVIIGAQLPQNNLGVGVVFDGGIRDTELIFSTDKRTASSAACSSIRGIVVGLNDAERHFAITKHTWTLLLNCVRR
jgi:hypothetical protein